MATTAEPTAQQIPTLIHLAALTHLEGQIRAAKTVQELQFLSVNETRRLIPYDNAFLLSPPGSDKETCRVLNVSSVAVVDRHAPMIVWLEQAVQALFRAEESKKQPMVVTEELLPDSLRSGWRARRSCRRCTRPATTRTRRGARGCREADAVPAFAGTSGQ